MTREELLKIAKPVLFNTEMVRAILNGTKCCTRRIIKPQPIYSEKDGFSWKGVSYGTNLPPTVQGASYNFCHKAQYQVEDILYVRETWMDYAGRVMYKADCDKYRIESLKFAGFGWKPSLHMPKKAARIFLKVTGVRAERLQDITEKQAVREGCQAGSFEFHGAVWGQEDSDEWTVVDDFIELWNSTIDRKELDQYGWDANPWVWVYDFELVKYEK